MKQQPTLTITPRRELAGYARIDIDLQDVRAGNVRCRQDEVCGTSRRQSGIPRKGSNTMKTPALALRQAEAAPPADLAGTSK